MKQLSIGFSILAGIVLSFGLFLLAASFFLFLIIGPLWLAFGLNSALWLLIYIPSCLILGALYQDNDLIF